MKTAILTFASITYALAGLFLVVHFAPREPASLPGFDSGNSAMVMDNIVDAGFASALDPVEEELLKARTIVVTTDINAQVSRKVVRQLLLLNAQDYEEPINIFLRTEGGWEADAFSIIDVMTGLDAPVHIHALGEVSSAGCMILAAGTGNRIVYPHTVVSFHAWIEENTPDYSEADTLLFRSRYTHFFREHTDLPKEWLEKTGGEYLFMNPRQAVEFGVADFVAAPEPRPATDTKTGRPVEL